MMINAHLAHLRDQKTLAAPLVFVGIGLHSGQRTTMRIHPAEADHGITIARRDLPRRERIFRAHWYSVAETTLCTTIDNPFGHRVATVEHLLSALAGLGIDNASIELDGPEIPVLDGSAEPFVTAIKNTGIKTLQRPREVILILRPVRLQQGESWAELLPDTMQRITISIDFNQHDIGLQSLSFCLSPTVYEKEIAPARTFGFAEQLAQLRRRGLALGGSIKNAILLREGRVANLEGLRFRDEFVRHKALDAIGDLSLAGAAIIGHYRGHRPGHRLNTELLGLLMHDTEAWVRLPLDAVDRAMAEYAERATMRDSRPGGEDAHQGLDRQTAGGSIHNVLTERLLRLLTNDRR